MNNAVRVGQLVSVNIGLPQDVSWNGQRVHTGIWKEPTAGPAMVRRLNIDGDGQGDLNGHGGENRAVLVYQTQAYDYWKSHLGRDDLTAGSFGENFTVDGLPDDEVCIGDRYRIGDAVFEVTQPRVTCFRVGMRLGEPAMPNLLVAHHRPGFYLRVLTEGSVSAGDDILLVERGPRALSVAAVDALLYLPDRDVDTLRKAVDIPALSPGWVQSFRDLLTPPETVHAVGWNGFRTLRVRATHRETSDVLSVLLESGDGTALPAATPGQYLTLRVPGAGAPAPLRSYSLSGGFADGTYRISIKRDAHGLLSAWLHDHVRAGTTLDAAAPRGEFVLSGGEEPIVLLSAGIGCTPVLAMLHELAAHRSARQVVWVHTTRDRASHAFADEVDELIASLPSAVQHLVYTADGPRLGANTLAAMNLPTGAAVYLCGPTGFMEQMREALVAAGTAPSAVYSESFGARSRINPGVVGAASAVPPHAPAGEPGTGPAVTFARSGLAAPWSPRFTSLLDFAEACDVPTRYSCRSGVCHICVTDVMSGETDYVQQPLEVPPAGSVLICSAVPTTGVVLDL
ncbi:sulfurase [Mycolicibacterium parafortuitum]|uniref:Sulfurase n=1 Tax=Mycolicibacterium parafortuitum TaxID=39692 RepID=A0A7I7TWI1_MYCPF|nr:MOSC and FAD-binding oxidoreductase domain-containing protein [Mycolicibacterium parafortuitum]BBY73542.1 sulfurase [Mycolicibacterium parafortuitum]